MVRAAGLVVLTLPHVARPATLTPVPIPIPGGVPVTQNVSSLNNTLQQVCALVQGASIRTTAQQDLAQTCSFLADPAALPGALRTAYMTMLGQQINALEPQIKMLEGSSDGLRERLTELRDGGRVSPVLGGSSGDQTTLLDGRLGLFVNGKLTSAWKNYGDNSFAYGIHDSSVTLGTDYRFTDSLVAGLAYTGSDTHIPFSENLGRMDLRENGINLYTSLYRGTFYLDALAGYGISSLDSVRNLSFTNTTTGETVNQQALGRSHVRHLWAGLSLGDQLSWRAFSLTPEGSLTFRQARLEPFTETMSQSAAPGSGLALAYGATTVPSLQARVGLSTGVTLSTPFGVLQPQAHGAYVRELRDAPATFTASFAAVESLGGTTSPIQIQSDDPDRHYFTCGGGLTATFAHGLSAFFDYERVSAARFLSSHTLSLGVRYQPFSR
jgi:hypothetical protein